jgi:hypothetical protein
VTSIDNGTLRLTEQERFEGWWTADAAKVFRGTSWCAALNTVRIGKLLTALGSLRFMDCQMRPMMNAARGMTSGMYSSNQYCPEKSRFS